MKEIKSRILELRRLINKHNHNYYDLDTNIISDLEYDKLLEELIDLENKYPEFYDIESPSRRVGGGLSDKFDSDTHIFPMYSLDNTYSDEELDSWYKRIVKALDISDFEFCCELKYDGASVNLLYENGELKPDVKLTGHFHYKHKKVNVKEVLGEIDDAREEAEARAEYIRSR